MLDLRLNDDWQGADFIAVNGEDMLKIQLKGRLKPLIYL